MTEMKKYFVYVHTCPNGKRYVGCTKQARPEYRWGRNGEGYKSQLFGKAVRKYGWSSIKHEAWELTCESEMHYAEKYLIAYYHTTESEFGYNLSMGGESGNSGCRYSEEVRKKASEAAKKRWSDPEYLRKQSEAQKKAHSDPEYRKKASEAAKKRCSDPEYRKYLSEVNKKSHSDPEYREKISKAKKGKSHKPCSEEARKRIAELHRGKTLGEEHRKHCIEAAKKRCSDPEYRKKLSEARKKEWSDPEFRRKKSETAKNRPRIKIKLPDGTIIEITKQLLTRWYVNKGKEFEYVS